MSGRRRAREWALKLLYAAELSGNSLAQVTEQILDRKLAGQYREFTIDLVQRTALHQQWIDQIIRDQVQKWELARIAVLDRILLRLAICEIFFFPDIPPKVTINEAIEIARKYSTEKSDKFVNGVLDAVMHQKWLKGPPERPPEAQP